MTPHATNLPLDSTDMDLITADDPLSSHVLGELKEAEAECLRDAIKNVSLRHMYTRWSFLTEALNLQWLLSCNHEHVVGGWDWEDGRDHESIAYAHW